jgi:micrococcal nuclease
MLCLYAYTDTIHAEEKGQRIFTVKVTEVYDGDTFKFEYNRMPYPLNKMSIRLNDIDTPEIRGSKCEAEKLKAFQARDYLISLIKGKRVRLRNYSWDKYGGRIDADAYVGRINLSEAMIAAGYAVPYTGKGHKKNWCVTL